MVPAVLAPGRGGVGQPDDASGLFADLHLGGAAAARAGAATARAAARAVAAAAAAAHLRGGTRPSYYYIFERKRNERTRMSALNLGL